MEPEKTPRERAEDLISLLVADWRPTTRQGLWAIRIGIVLGLLFALGHAYGVTLWDWIKLLIVPAVIAAGGLWFNAQQRRREHELANEQAQDEALQAYLDQMSQLVTDKELPLHNAQPGDSLSTLARARRLTVLSRLDSRRKKSVLEFLYESRLIEQEQVLLDDSDLIEKRHNIVSLKRADLNQANLMVANLIGADLSKAILVEASLGHADLSDAALSRANLTLADLIGANLRSADLSEAMLIADNLFGARLMGPTYSRPPYLGPTLAWLT